MPTEPPGGRRPLVLDTATGRVGEVMDSTTINHRELVYLRPPGGGYEWETDASSIQAVPHQREASA